MFHATTPDTSHDFSPHHTTTTPPLPLKAHHTAPCYTTNCHQDYPLSDDIELSSETPIIYSWRSGEGIGKHPNSQRGAVQVNFEDGSVTDEDCSDAEEYYALHGALLLVAWMVIAPYGIYQAR